MMRVLLVALLVLLALAGFTYWALESSGVARVVTTRPDGTARVTHVWYVSRGGELWLEAGTPENPWFQDAERVPRVELRVDGITTPYRAEPLRDPSGHAMIRARMREKYGVRDAWVALLFDTSRSLAVRLLPEEDAAAAR